MTAHESLQEMLALSAAGLLEPAEERQVREHIRECPACARRLDEFADLSAVLRGLPMPLAPPDLAIRTQAVLAESADRRQAAFLAAGSAVLAWSLSLGIAYVYRAFTGGSLVGWMLWSTAPALMAVPVIAGLFRRCRIERIVS